MTRVLVSIVNWNTRDALRRCLASLADIESGLDVAVVVVDNASTDGSADMVQAEFPGVRLIRAGHNLGFAGGNNLALEGAAADYVFVLNPDVVLGARSAQRLVSFLEVTPEAAAASPALADADGGVQSHMYRRFPTVAQVALFWTVLRPVAMLIAPLRRRIFEHDLRGDSPVQVDQLPGAAMMIRGSALETVGRMDPGYFIWWEDVDWCYRARTAGFSLYVLPDVRVEHVGGASFGAWSLTKRVFQFYRAFFRFLAVHRLHRLARRVAPIIRADLALKDLALRLVRQDDAGLADTRRAVRDAMRGMPRGNVPTFHDAGTVRTRPAALSKREPYSPVTDVVIVNWNGRRWLERCIRAVRESTVPVRVILVDNDSSDGSADFVAETFPDVHLIRAGHNAGYAGGANIGLAASHGNYAFVMNPDVVLESRHLESLRDRLDADPRIGAAQGKLFGLTPAEFEAGETPRSILDSAGHVIRRSRMVVDRGQGQPDAPEYDLEASIFSACGAAILLRRSMLEDVAPEGEFFAESFFAYKEDIDLGWRARLRGWDIRYVPDAIAHHVRSVPYSPSAWRATSLAARRHSWKNHYLLMLRNDRVVDMLRALPFIAGWEALRLGHALLRDRSVLAAYGDVIAEIGPALRHRRRELARRSVNASEIRRWFGGEPLPSLPPAHRATRAV